ncbi:MAG TPA: putative toxin-antitoxin system toxin component, PIN family [Accumulibacter sp.]|uniref:putative toxin-antitoxin system toxin component, PIN family n=1 Tax=Accumulibacter sp. TaxID=2053492 RepID=UPI000EDACA1A|nr:putative toxin-antitoxin system toxin component, PIN family [Accumulibacter sp.]HCZ16305.1 putative toxin-antitoxin system toxin component, PIN family [Accumulibacter sp.]HRF73985.1 putative toxin-antitoxin system toxin component, PIN family [Accumulibacter sp.]
MKVVIDTNVLVSAVIRDRLPERVLLWCVGNESVSWLVSPAILDEYLKVIRRPRFALPPELIGWWSELLLSDTLMTQITAAPDFPRDPKDACFLACAGANGVDFLITGDADFTEARALLPTLRIVSVREFAQIVGLEPSV